MPECPFIPEPACGSVDQPCLDVGCVSTFSCDVGCVLSSEIDRSVCQPNEKWAPIPPTCEGRELNHFKSVYTAAVCMVHELKVDMGQSHGRNNASESVSSCR